MCMSHVTTNRLMNLVAAFKHLKIESLSDIPNINDVNNPQDLWSYINSKNRGPGGN